MLSFNLRKGSKVCNIHYFGEGVVYQAVTDVKTMVQGSVPTYYDNRKQAETAMIKEVYRLFGEGWELAYE